MIGSTSLSTTRECYCKRTVQNASRDDRRNSITPILSSLNLTPADAEHVYISNIPWPLPPSHLSTSPPFQSPHFLLNNSPLQWKQLRLRAQTTFKSSLMDPLSTVRKLEEPEWSSLNETH